MTKNQVRMGIAVVSLLGTSPRLAWSIYGDPTACVQEIEQVCVHLENDLETCLSDRGDKLSAGCREQLRSAMTILNEPSGPASCIPDIQRFCPDIKPAALTQCVNDQMSNFSEACQKYLNSAQPKTESSR